MKKKIHIVLLFIVVAALGVIVCNDIALHQKFPDPTIESFYYGETIELENCSITFTGWTWENAEEFSKKFPDYYRNNVDEKDDFRCGLIELTIMKKTDNEESLDLTDISFSSGAWADQFDLELFYLLNPNLGNMEASENKQVIILPMTMRKCQFSDKQWEQIDYQAFCVNVQFYPVHLRFEIQDPLNCRNRSL